MEPQDRELLGLLISNAVANGLEKYHADNVKPLEKRVGKTETKQAWMMGASVGVSALISWMGGGK